MAYKLKSSVKSLCSGSALPNLKSGGKMISSDKGSSNYMKEGPLYAKEDIGKPGYDKYGAELIGTKQARLKREKTASTKVKDNKPPSMSGSDAVKLANLKAGKNKEASTSAGPAPTVNPRKKVETRKKVESVGRPGKVSGTTVRKTGGGMTGTKVKVSPEIKTSGKTTEGIKDVKAKKASEPKEMSRKQIREAKKKDKDSGMSRKEVRLNKTKRKAASTRAKTVSKETAAKGGKEAQRLARKTIRLEKKAAKIEGRVKASKIK